MQADDLHASTLTLSDALRAELERLVRAAYPLEACGLLLGLREDAWTRVRAVRAARNVAREHARDHYEIDPAELLSAEREACALGLAVIGVWHSHPDRPARPSEADRARAWTGWSYVIAAVNSSGAVDLRAWRWDGNEFRPEALSDIESTPATLA